MTVVAHTGIKMACIRNDAILYCVIQLIFKQQFFSSIQYIYIYIYIHIYIHIYTYIFIYSVYINNKYTFISNLTSMKHLSRTICVRTTCRGTVPYIHSFIMDISILPLQVHYYSEAHPTTALIMCWS